MSRPRPPVSWRFWLPAGLALALLGVLLFAWGQPLCSLVQDEQRLRAWARGLGPWAPGAIALLSVVQVLLAPLPGQAIGAVSGYLFGPWLGTLYPMAGVFVGSTLAIFLARRWGRPLAALLAGPEAMVRLDDLARRGGALFFFLIWLLPFMPDDLACLAAGLTPLPAAKLLVVMFLGRLPGVFSSSWLGAHAAHLSGPAWASILILIAVAALALRRWGEAIQRWLLRLTARLARL